MNHILIGFIAYLVILFVKGILTYKYNRTLPDYILASRRIGPWLASFSERASGESAWLLVGLPGLALATGFNAIWPAIGCVFGIFFSWTFIATRLRLETEKYNAITIPDFLESRFGDDSHTLRITATIIIVIFFTIYVAAQFLAAGKVLNITFGISRFNGMLIGAGIILFYTVMGGFYAVVWTDFFQGALMVFTLVVLPVVGAIELGGINGLATEVSKIDPHLLFVGGGLTGWPMILSILGGLGIGLGYMGQPHLITRFMAIKNPKQLRQGSLIAVFWAILAFWGAVFMGIFGLAIFGNIFSDQEMIMPYMAKHLLPAGFAGILICGAIAAMMSTADSQLLVTTSAISEDIYHKLFKRDTSQKTLVTLSRIATLIVGIVAFILALTAESLVYWLVLYAWAGLGSSFGPAILLTLWWKKVTKQGIFAGMIGGTVTVLIWYNVPALKNFLYELIPGFIVSFILVVIVSLLTQNRNIQRIS